MGSILKKWFPRTTTPFICSAPMRIASGPALAVAVTKAGGLGFLGAGYELSNLSSWLRTCQEHLPTAPDQTFPIGVGFILWGASLNLALQNITTYRPCAVWLFAPKDQSQLESWITEIKAAAPWCKVFLQIGSVREVEDTLRGPAGDGVDVIVAQGVADSGGHGNLSGGSVMTLVPETVDLCRSLGRNVPIVAAGGIVDGRGVAANLMLGAEGVCLGTRLVASEEAEFPKIQKEYLVKAKDGGKNTVRTRIYDTIRGTGNWPAQYNGRAVVNATFHDHEAGVEEDENRRRYEKAVKEEDYGRLTTFAGTGVGLVHDIRPAAEIVRNVQDEARRLLERAASKL